MVHTVSPTTLVKIHAVRRVALADAERHDVIQRNVARPVKAPALAEEGTPVQDGILLRDQ